MAHTHHNLSPKLAMCLAHYSRNAKWSDRRWMLLERGHERYEKRWIWGAILWMLLGNYKRYEKHCTSHMASLNVADRTPLSHAQDGDNYDPNPN